MTVPDRAATVPGTVTNATTVTVPRAPDLVRARSAQSEGAARTNSTTNTPRHGHTLHEQIATLIGFHLDPWRRRAACIDEPTSTFYDASSSARALQICDRCPVRDECLSDALEDDLADYGIRGGATASARKQMRKAAS